MPLGLLQRGLLTDLPCVSSHNNDDCVMLSTLKHPHRESKERNYLCMTKEDVKKNHYKTLPEETL